MAPDGSGFTLLHSFAGRPLDGFAPLGSLIQDLDGTLYGMTDGGGFADLGAVFRMAPDGSGFTLLHSFTGAPTDGQYPFGSLTQGLDGTLYGTTEEGGSAYTGTIFQIAPDGSAFTLMHSFTGGDTDGATPRAGLIQGPDGTLYGTTYAGGSALFGTVFQIAPDGSGFTLLHSFVGPEGYQPLAELILDPDGTLYGTAWQDVTARAGVVFSIRPGP